MTRRNCPKGLGTAGKRLWSDLTTKFELEPHEERLLLEAARTVDLLDALEAEIARAHLIVGGPQGDHVNPAAIEARQQRLALTRMLAALKIPVAAATGSGRIPSAQLHGISGVA